MNVIQDTTLNVASTYSPPLEVTNHTLPSERIPARIWWWLAISAPILWLVHAILLGLGFIVAEHFGIPDYMIGLVYGFFCIQSTSDVYNSISTILHNRNTLLGYLYSLGLSVGNIGFWLLATDTTYASFVLLLMIASGLLTGRWTELQMRKHVYSEEQRTYLTESEGRTFPIEYLPTVLKFTQQGQLSSLKTLPVRYNENCCHVKIHYSKTSTEAIINVETEVESEVSLAGFTFVLPMTQRQIVSSRIVNLRDYILQNLESGELDRTGDGSTVQ